ncbi:MAG: DUF429 domain-containing protein [Vampirovibrionales bacterium]|nr:DUF429 domain-containing protein [Vampirovibrionales bacterium]
MLCVGIDFTSAPRKCKPITAVFAQRQSDRLLVTGLEHWVSFDALRQWLTTSVAQTWLCAIDAPLSFPYAFWEFFDWPADNWQRCAEKLSQLSMQAFEAMVAQYSQTQAPGQKLPMRPTDRLTKSSSPVRLYRVPVGRMAFRLWPILLESTVDIRPVHTSERPQHRTMIEGYPAMVARAFIGKTPYKSELSCPDRSPSHRRARQMLLEAVQQDGCQDLYGFRVDLPEAIASTMLEDFRGDSLDAMSCCMQAAWAASREDFGIPRNIKAAKEGWIVDPQCLLLAQQTLQ